MVASFVPPALGQSISEIMIPDVRTIVNLFGISPRVYLSDLMLHEPKLLLANPRLSVQHISSILGYRDKPTSVDNSKDGRTYRQASIAGSTSKQKVFSKSAP